MKDEFPLDFGRSLKDKDIYCQCKHPTEEVVHVMDRERDETYYDTFCRNEGCGKQIKR